MLTGDLRKLQQATGGKNKTCSKMDVSRIGKNFGYFVRLLQRMPREEYVEASKAVLEHHFDNHEHCGDWCIRKNQSLVERASKDWYYRSKHSKRMPSCM